MSHIIHSVDEHARSLVEDAAATHADLLDLGYRDYTARKLARIYVPAALAPTGFRQVGPLAAATDLVTLVPSGPTARTYWPMGAYLRDLTLRGQVRLASSYLATDTNGAIAAVHPITARYRIGSAAALDHIATPTAAAVAAHPDTLANWPTQAWYYELGPAIPLGLALGYARTGTGGIGALAGIRHHHLADLQALAATGGRLKGLPSA